MPRRRFYVGATGDGTIYRGTLGDHTVHTFIAGVPGSRSAVGLKIFRHKLYVAGGMTGKLFVYDLKHPATDPITLDTGAGGFLNDLVVTGKGNVYVTDSFRPTLWHVAAKQVKPLGVIDPISVSPEIPYTAGAFNLNGIVAFRGDVNTSPSSGSTPDDPEPESLTWSAIQHCADRPPWRSHGSAISSSTPTSAPALSHSPCQGSPATATDSIQSAPAPITRVAWLRPGLLRQCWVRRLLGRVASAE
jgi:hypothetical protein